MSNKDDILKRYRANVREKFDMPDLSDIKAIQYPDPLVQFISGEGMRFAQWARAVPKL